MNEKKPYLMNITETRSKKVIIWADDRASAINAAKDWCDEGRIDMADASFNRLINVQFKAEDYDLNIFEEYMKE